MSAEPQGSAQDVRIRVPVQEQFRAVLQDDQGIRDLLGDPALENADFIADFVRLLEDALTPFLVALKGGRRLDAVADLFVLCRDAAPRYDAKIRVGLAAAFAAYTAGLLRELRGPLDVPVTASPVPPDAPPPDPTMSRMEPTSAIDPAAVVARFSIPVPRRVATYEGLLRTFDESVQLTIVDVANVLESMANKLSMLAVAVSPPSAGRRRAEQIAFKEKVSAFLVQRTGNRMDRVAAAVFNFVFGTKMTTTTFARSRRKRAQSAGRRRGRR